MEMTSYGVDWLGETLPRLGFEGIEIRIVFGDSTMALKHPFLLARKRAS